MQVLRQFWDSERGLFTLLLFLAFAMRVMIPAGYMPTATKTGFDIILCTGDTVRTVHVDLGGNDEPDTPQHSGDNACLFTCLLSGGLVAAAAMLLVSAPVFTKALSSFGAIADLILCRLAAPPPPAIGPPART